MKVQDIMTRAPLACRPDMNLAEVAHRMWQADCGLIPVTDEAGHVLGVITDRDICIAAATRDQAPSYLRAASLTRGHVVCCRPGDSVGAALRLMRDHRVRRLPVVSDEGVLQGVISMNDIVLELKEGGAVTPGDVVEALQGICAHHHPPAPRPAVPAPPRRNSRVPRAVARPAPR
jgi:CBS domain-containing protein